MLFPAATVMALVAPMPEDGEYSYGDRLGEVGVPDDFNLQVLRPALDDGRSVGEA